MTRIEYRTLNDLAYDRIRDGLMAGSFHPGQTLVSRTLAEGYGISTTPVREALQRLAAERLLTLLPNRSIAVPAPEAGKYAEPARIRCELEGWRRGLPRRGCARRRCAGSCVRPTTWTRAWRRGTTTAIAGRTRPSTSPSKRTPPRRA